MCLIIGVLRGWGPRIPLELQLEPAVRAWGGWVLGPTGSSVKQHALTWLSLLSSSSHASSEKSTRQTPAASPLLGPVYGLLLELLWSLAPVAKHKSSPTSAGHALLGTPRPLGQPSDVDLITSVMLTSGHGGLKSTLHLGKPGSEAPSLPVSNSRSFSFRAWSL